jgi:hypothetical protein
MGEYRSDDAVQEDYGIEMEWAGDDDYGDEVMAYERVGGVQEDWQRLTTALVGDTILRERQRTLQLVSMSPLERFKIELETFIREEGGESVWPLDRQRILLDQADQLPLPVYKNPVPYALGFLAQDLIPSELSSDQDMTASQKGPYRHS